MKRFNYLLLLVLISFPSGFLYTQTSPTLIDIGIAEAQIQKLALMNSELDRTNLELEENIRKMSLELPSFREELKRLEAATIELEGKVDPLREAVKTVIDQTVLEKALQALSRGEKLLEEFGTRIKELNKKIEDSENLIELFRKQIEENSRTKTANLRSLENLRAAITYTLEARVSLDPVIEELLSTVNRMEELVPKK